MHWARVRSTHAFEHFSELTEALTRYARIKGFRLSIRNSDADHCEWRCWRGGRTRPSRSKKAAAPVSRMCGCKVHFNASYRKGVQRWVVNTRVTDHNHVLTPQPLTVPQQLRELTDTFLHDLKPLVNAGVSFQKIRQIVLSVRARGHCARAACAHVH